MKQNLMKAIALGFATSLTLALMVYGQDLKQMMQEKAAALRQSVAQNQAALRHYTWVEKTELSLKGEVKSTKVDSCQYGAGWQGAKDLRERSAAAGEETRAERQSY